MNNVGVQYGTIVRKFFYNVDDTLRLMDELSTNYAYQVRDIALGLAGNDEYETCENVWNWVRSNIAYEHDDYENELKGRNNLDEIVRRPARLIADGKGDCDCMVVTVRAMLNWFPSIKHTSKATSYVRTENGKKVIPKKNEFEHVYTLALLSDGRQIVIDTVPEIPYFGFEAKPIYNFKCYPKININMNSLKELSGIGDVDIDLLKSEALATNSFDDIESVNGLFGDLIIDEEPVEEGQTEANRIALSSVVKQALYADLVDQRHVMVTAKVDNAPLIYICNIDEEIAIITNIIDNWNTEGLNDALNNAINSDTIFIEYYKGIAEQLENNQVARVSGLDSMVYLGSFKTWLKDPNKGKIIKTLVNPVYATKQTMKVVKKIVPKKIMKVIQKTNPACIAVRTAALVAIKTNLFKTGSKLHYGMLDATAAKAHGLNMAEWQKFSLGYAKTKKFWVESLGGDAKTLDNNVKSAKINNALKGFGNLGEPITAAAVVAAATAFLTAVASFFKGAKIKTVTNGGDTDDGASVPELPSVPATELEQIEAIDNLNLNNMDTNISEGGGNTATGGTSWFAKNKKILLWSGIGVFVLLLIFMIIYFVKKSGRKKKMQGVVKRLQLGKARARAKRMRSGNGFARPLRGMQKVLHPSPFSTIVPYTRVKPFLSPQKRAAIKRKRKSVNPKQTKLFRGLGAIEEAQIISGVSGLSGRRSGRKRLSGKRGNPKGQAALKKFNAKVKAYRSTHRNATYRQAQKACKF